MSELRLRGQSVSVLTSVGTGNELRGPGGGVIKLGARILNTEAHSNSPVLCCCSLTA